ncbi:DddA-like double-stranded DNA deaminase toxin [Amycolatopsis sp. NPDC051128]|uniref:DddA-like double-stranded DNA deaminase toxin n=1 Tax=Amycolatopsis sp. NPDC051128 TaxID=3155412 RepID=UPI003429F733
MSSESFVPDFEKLAEVASTAAEATGEVTKADTEVVGNAVESASREPENAHSEAPPEHADKVAQLGRQLDIPQIDASTMPSDTTLGTQSPADQTNEPTDTQPPDNSPNDHTAELFENPADVASTVAETTGEATKTDTEVAGNAVESASREPENAHSETPPEHADKAAQLGRQLDIPQIDASTKPSDTTLGTQSPADQTNEPTDTQPPDNSPNDHTAELTDAHSDSPSDPATETVEVADRSRAPAKEDTDPAAAKAVEKDRYKQGISLDELDHAAADEPFTNKHGDCYPPEAADLAERLPKRVVPDTQMRTVAVARWNGHVLPNITSGYDALASDAERLLRDHDCTPSQARYLKSHAEIKVAELMLRRADMTDVEVAINNTPCGIEKQQEYEATCDKLLARIFPDDGDRSLTVYGTYQDNQPYEKRYGRAQP